MKFEYKQLEDGTWEASYPDLGLMVRARTKGIGTDLLISGVIHLCHTMLAFYGCRLTEAREAETILATAKERELQ